MANGGWHGTEEERNRVEAPLKLLDPVLDRFAHEHGLKVTKNHKDQPERSIRWGTAVHCLIQIFLVDQPKLTFDLWICASQDRGDGRFWKKETPRKGVQATDVAEDLFDLLEAAKRTLDHWSAHPEELELAAKLGGYVPLPLREGARGRGFPARPFAMRRLRPAETTKAPRKRRKKSNHHDTKRPPGTNAPTKSAQKTSAVMSVVSWRRHSVLLGALVSWWFPRERRIAPRRPSPRSV